MPADLLDGRGGFEVDVANWFSTASGTIQRSTAAAKSGVGSALLTANVTGTNKQFYPAQMAINESLRVYSTEVWFMWNGGTPRTMRLDIMSNAGDTLGPSFLAQVGTWNRLVLENVTIPAGGTLIRPRLVMLNPADTTASVYIDDFKFYNAASVTDPTGTKTFTMWNGTAEVPLTLEGQWNGTSVVPLSVT